MKKQSSENAKISTILGKGCVLNGDFNADGSARIDGTVNGNVIVKGKLILGVDGKINGDVQATGALIGVCQGGDKLETGKVMLDIDPTSIFRETYEDKPTVGAFVLGCKLVVAVDEANGTFDYILRGDLKVPEVVDPETGETTEQTLSEE